MTNTLKAAIDHLQIEGEKVELDRSRRGNMIKLELKADEGGEAVLHYNFGVFNEGSAFSIDRKQSTGFAIAFASSKGNSCSFSDDVYIKELNGIIKGAGIIHTMSDELKTFIEQELDIIFDE
ncbi:hypothetical protein [Fodinibius saliphilus]|uniref:hypothetical protein n=1 Tax=Fodinibius saliphilus TaxID=1920650 RepID=UPI001109567A|nr:hypothetical protein [Fodinibius saliphilus]